jgi:hypothetical protein
LFQRLYESRPAMMATSVAIAIVLWFVISIAIYPTTPRTLHHVPLKVEIAGTSAEENGLSVIDYDVQDVTVQIEGNRSKVGNGCGGKCHLCRHEKAFHYGQRQ